MAPTPDVSHPVVIVPSDEARAQGVRSWAPPTPFWGPVTRATGTAVADPAFAIAAASSSDALVQADVSGAPLGTPQDVVAEGMEVTGEGSAPRVPLPADVALTEGASEAPLAAPAEATDLQANDSMGGGAIDVVPPSEELLDMFEEVLADIGEDDVLCLPSPRRKTRHIVLSHTGDFPLRDEEAEEEDDVTATMDISDRIFLLMVMDKQKCNVRLIAHCFPTCQAGLLSRASPSSPSLSPTPITNFPISSC